MIVFYTKWHNTTTVKPIMNDIGMEFFYFPTKQGEAQKL